MLRYAPYASCERHTRPRGRKDLSSVQSRQAFFASPRAQGRLLLETRAVGPVLVPSWFQRGKSSSLRLMDGREHIHGCICRSD